MLLRIDRVSNVFNFHLSPAWKNVVDTTSVRSSARLWLLKLLIQHPFRFFQVLLTNWSKTWQSGLFTGNPPSSSCSKSVNSEIVVWSFTFPAPGHTSIPIFNQAALTQLKNETREEFRTGVRLSEVSCRCLQKPFSCLLAEIILDRIPPLQLSQQAVRSPSLIQVCTTLWW